jgi:hypothetical protein
MVIILLVVKATAGSDENRSENDEQCSIKPSASPPATVDGAASFQVLGKLVSLALPNAFYALNLNLRSDKR